MRCPSGGWLDRLTWEGREVTSPRRAWILMSSGWRSQSARAVPPRRPFGLRDRGQATAPNAGVVRLHLLTRPSTAWTVCHRRGAQSADREGRGSQTRLGSVGARGTASSVDANMHLERAPCQDSPRWLPPPGAVAPDPSGYEVGRIRTTAAASEWEAVRAFDPRAHQGLAPEGCEDLEPSFVLASGERSSQPLISASVRSAQPSTVLRRLTKKSTARARM